MRRIRFVFVTILALALLATLFLWFQTRNTAQYIAISTDYRSAANSQASFVGHWSCGLYAAKGRIGFLDHSETCSGFDPETIATMPRQPTRFLWRRSDDPDGNTYIGGLSSQMLANHVTFSHAGIQLLDGTEAGMSHAWEVRGGLVDTWIIALFLAAPLAVTTWRIDRPRRLLQRGRCPTCAYDLRTQLLGPASAICPECGTPIALDKK